MKYLNLLLIASSLFAGSCGGTKGTNKLTNTEKIMKSDSTEQYGFNRDFLKDYKEIIELRNSNSAITMVPDWQGRVMTSTAEGDSGFSFGWINRSLIASLNILKHINAFGGEERLWVGPEGGQYSIFFGKGKSFVYDNWQTPAFLDTEPFEVCSKTDTSVKYRRKITLENYSGNIFNAIIEREVILLSSDEILKQTMINTRGLKCVCYSSINTLINEGDEAWERESGLLSIWMLGMFNPSPSVVIVIPVKSGDEKTIGPIVKDDYFGKISSDRLKNKEDHIFFRADGKSRGKIGISPSRAAGVMGSYDSENKILTILMCKLPEGKNDYVNSAWEIQKTPYSGDVLNAYNDGPLEDGSLMGPFYELETSSPAVELKPGGSLSHIQFTLHLTGDIKELDRVSRQVLGVTLDQIRRVF